ncbi:hypothetical protein [Isoptericola variabilis]|uniref:Uncharacterized protein n=1 Tax=Isoptericola variabilis (strain 225) TaxID=743718 RepID=F6FT99_ISOV2|nr:hypothetical protein [Isoptericola variabilis]AEG45263.1 hypothetical protein Isova_2559 [Isoptericola variabilis 225]TWH30966.1 hypothetical protein L600_002800000310 [Isoptericola variabilis J7]
MTPLDPIASDDVAGPAPGPARLALRPLGYLLVGLVWTAIFVVAVLLWVGTLVYVAVDDSVDVGAMLDRVASDPAEAVGFALALPLLAAVMGAGAMFLLPTASFPLAALSFVYAMRALRPSYAGERLSFTVQAGAGQTIGLPTLHSVALSLLPVRRSRVTDALVRVYAAGWTPTARSVLAAVPAGVGWLLAVAAVSEGLPGPARVACGVLAVVLVVVSAVLVVRAVRARSAADAGGDGRPVTALDPDERRARLRELRRRRDARLGGR